MKIITRILNRIERPLTWSLIGASVWIALVVIVQTAWSWNITFDFVFARAGTPTSVHSVPALAMIGLGAIWSVRTRKLYGMFAFPFFYGMHELIWNIFFAFYYAGQYAPTHVVIELVSFSAMIAVSGYYLRPPARKILLVAVGFVLFMLAWVFAGFPITVIITPTGAVPTADIMSFVANMFEVTGWYVLVYFSIPWQTPWKKREIV